MVSDALTHRQTCVDMRLARLDNKLIDPCVIDTHASDPLVKGKLCFMLDCVLFGAYSSDVSVRPRNSLAFATSICTNSNTVEEMCAELAQSVETRSLDTTSAPKTWAHLVAINPAKWNGTVSSVSRGIGKTLPVSSGQILSPVPSRQEVLEPKTHLTSESIQLVNSAHVFIKVS